MVRRDDNNDGIPEIKRGESLTFPLKMYRTGYKGNIRFTAEEPTGIYVRFTPPDTTSQTLTDVIATVTVTNSAALGSVSIPIKGLPLPFAGESIEIVVLEADQAPYNVTTTAIRGAQAGDRISYAVRGVLSVIDFAPRAPFHYSFSIRNSANALVYSQEVFNESATTRTSNATDLPAGTYSFATTVTDADGVIASSSVNEVITIDQTPPPPTVVLRAVIRVNQGLSANVFNLSGDAKKVGGSFFPADGGNFTYEFDFGDGSAHEIKTSTGTSVTSENHAYPTATANYAVSVKITKNGQSSTATENVNVVQAPAPVFLSSSIAFAADGEDNDGNPNRRLLRGGISNSGGIGSPPYNVRLVFSDGLPDMNFVVQGAGSGGAFNEFITYPNSGYHLATAYVTDSAGRVAQPSAAEFETSAP